LKGSISDEARLLQSATVLADALPSGRCTGAYAHVMEYQRRPKALPVL